MIICSIITFALSLGSVMLKSVYPLALTFMMFLSLVAVSDGSTVKYIFPSIQILYTGYIAYLYITQNYETSILLYLIIISGLTLLLMLPAILKRPAPSKV